MTGWSILGRMARCPSRTTVPSSCSTRSWDRTTGSRCWRSWGSAPRSIAWDDSLCESFVDRGFYDGALRQPRRREVHVAGRPDGRPRHRGRALPGRRAAERPLLDRGHGGRRRRGARRRRLGQRAHHGRVDGRHDRPGLRHRLPRAHPLAHLDHVDHRRPGRRPTRRGRRRVAPDASRHDARRGDRCGRRHRPGHLQPRALRRGRRARVRRARVRPRLPPRGRAAAAPGGPHPDVAHRGAACTRRACAGDPREDGPARQPLRRGAHPRGAAQQRARRTARRRPRHARGLPARAHREGRRARRGRQTHERTPHRIPAWSRSPASGRGRSAP